MAKNKKRILITKHWKVGLLEANKEIVLAIDTMDFQDTFFFMLPADAAIEISESLKKMAQELIKNRGLIN